MDGVEVRHPSHSADDTARLAALVEHFSLVPSGGSDWHGSSDGPRTLGMMRVPAEWLGRQDSRIRARAA
jgi:3',5'-nucleoside bisphosphate phosphatase